jgi:hypothetical protein
MPNSREPGFTPIFRNPQFKNELTKTPDPSIRTYRDTILKSFLEKFPKNKLAGTFLLNQRANRHQKVDPGWEIS